MMKRFLLAIAALILLFALSSCCYNMGSISNPQIKTIAIAPVVNDTVIPNCSESIRHELHEQFQLDGSLKIRGMDCADCVLYGKVTNISLGSVGMNVTPKGTIYQTTQFTVTMSFEYTIVIPGRAAPLAPMTQVSGTAQYQVPGDMYMAQQNALVQAARQIARQVVNNVTEAW